MRAISKVIFGFEKFLSLLMPNGLHNTANRGILSPVINCLADRNPEKKSESHLLKEKKDAWSMVTAELNTDAYNF